MKLNSISAVFFSPTGSTGKVVKEIADSAFFSSVGLFKVQLPEPGFPEKDT